MSRLVHSISAIAIGAVLALGLAMVHQSAYAQLGGVGDAVGGAAEAAGGVAGEAAGAAAEAGAKGGAEAAAPGTEAGANVEAQAGAEAAAGAGEILEGATEAAGEAAGAAQGAAEAATDAAGEAGAQASTAAEITAALGGSLNAANNRVSVDSVQQGGILANAGVQPGDEIVAVADQQVTSEAELIDQLRAAADAGNEVILRVRRNGQLQELTANLGARAHTVAKVVTDLADIGADASADSVLQSFVGTQLGGENGLVIQNVQRGSLAARANLTGGDEILAVGGHEVTPENFYPRLQADLLQDGRASIRIRRGDQVYRAPINLCR